MDEFLATLLQSLNMIEVKGKDNLNILLGCILAIEQEQEKLASPAPKEIAEGE